MKRWGAVVLAAVIGGAAGAASLTGGASATTIPFDVDFGIVMPGEAREARIDVVVPVVSTVTAAGWDHITGGGAWGAALCDAGGVCTPVDELVGATLQIDTYELVLGITMPEAATGTATAGRGRISLEEIPELPLSDGGLAATGGTLPWIAAAIGAVALGSGAAILLRRRRDDKEEEMTS